MSSGASKLTCGVELDQISNVSDTRIEKLEKKFPVGKKVRGRVIGHRVMDVLSIASMKVNYPLLWKCDSSLSKALLIVHNFHCLWMTVVTILQALLELMT